MTKNHKSPNNVRGALGTERQGDCFLGRRQKTKTLTRAGTVTSGIVPVSLCPIPASLRDRAASPRVQAHAPSMCLVEPDGVLSDEGRSKNKNAHMRWAFLFFGVPTGIRTPVTAVKEF